MDDGSQPHGLLVTAIIFALLLIQQAVVAQDTGEGDVVGRSRITINDGWRFFPGDAPGASETNHDDGVWKLVDVPHTWNAEDAYDKTPGYRRGIGWYRNYLRDVEISAGRRYYVYFEGANQVADVFVNGAKVGSHIGGYTAFVFDITDQLQLAGPNVLAVRVDNRHDPNIPPLDADFTFFGGIYRDVWILSTEEVHIDVLNHASPGIFVDTPEVTDTLATVRVRGRLLNEGTSDQTVTVRSRIVQGEDLIAEFEFELDVQGGSGESFDVATPGIPGLELWSPDRPYLYGVVTELLVGGRVTDRVTVPLGVRSVGISDQGGLLLNGRRIRLNGTNRHQDYPGFGNAVPDWVHRKDVTIVKETGFNFLRLAHYPQDPVVLAETDRLGLAVWEEIPIVNLITMSEAFDDNSELMLVEMIRQHYNHPSILMWGYMNEVMLREPRPVPDGYYERLLRLAKTLEEVVKREDPTRVSVMAQSVGEVYNGKGLSDVTDFLGMNLYFGWYYGAFDSLGTFLDRLHREHPGRPLLVSEYGAGSDERVHTTAPRAFDFSSEHAQNFHMASLRIMNDRPYLVGSAVWNQFDFGSEGRQDTKNAINQKGLYFYDRTPKDIAYYYRASLLDEPVLHIANEWSNRAGSLVEDAVQPVWVYTNTEEVELFVNNEPISVRKVAGNRVDWDVTLDDGANVIRAIAADANGVIVAESQINYDDRTSLFGPRAESGDVLAVNCGGHYAFSGSDGLVWEPDRAFESGSWGYVGGTARRVHHRITGTDADPLFQATRDSVEAYRFDVADGRYDVEILLAETRPSEDRPAFSIRANGASVSKELRIGETAGRYRAVRRTVEAEARNASGIIVQFDPPSAATVSGILIRRR